MGPLHGPPAALPSTGVRAHMLSAICRSGVNGEREVVLASQEQGGAWPWEGLTELFERHMGAAGPGRAQQPRQLTAGARQNVAAFTSQVCENPGLLCLKRTGLSRNDQNLFACWRTVCICAQHRPHTAYAGESEERYQGRGTLRGRQHSGAAVGRCRGGRGTLATSGTGLREGGSMKGRRAFCDIPEDLRCARPARDVGTQPASANSMKAQSSSCSLPLFFCRSGL